MGEGWIRPERVFSGDTLHSGAALRVQDGRVVELSSDAPEGATFKGCISAGFIDLQVNGGGGVLLNTTPSRDGMVQIAAAHRMFGTTSVLPTVITDTPEVLDAAAEAAIAAKGDIGQLGLHIEGPHISKAKRGTHKAEYLRPLDARTMDVVAKLRRAEVAVMITVAPEAATPAQIACLVDLGAVVSLGHTDATAQSIEAALAAGATCGTHLFNAMSGMQGRAPGAIGAILNSRACFGIICDGHHVDNQMVALALRAAGPDRGFLVSDAMATVGGADHFDLYGKTIRVDGGRLINDEGNLAGAHVTQAEGVRRLVRNVGVGLETALRMAISTPARVIGRPELASVVGCMVEDLIVLDNDLNMRFLSD